MTTKTIIEKIPFSVIKDFVDKILRENGKLSQEIYLGGSMSPNCPKNPHENSDIDLFIIIENDEEIICPNISNEELLQEEVLYFGETLLVITPIFPDMFIEKRHEWIKL